MNIYITIMGLLIVFMISKEICRMLLQSRKKRIVCHKRRTMQTDINNSLSKIIFKIENEDTSGPVADFENWMNGRVGIKTQKNNVSILGSIRGSENSIRVTLESEQRARYSPSIIMRVSWSQDTKEQCVSREFPWSICNKKSTVLDMKMFVLTALKLAMKQAK